MVGCTGRVAEVIAFNYEELVQILGGKVSSHEEVRWYTWQPRSLGLCGLVILLTHLVDQSSNFLNAHHCLPSSPNPQQKKMKRKRKPTPKKKDSIHPAATDSFACTRRIRMNKNLITFKGPTQGPPEVRTVSLVQPY